VRVRCRILSNGAGPHWHASGSIVGRGSRRRCELSISSPGKPYAHLSYSSTISLSPQTRARSQILPVIPMSTSNQSPGPSTSTDNFSAIFNAASTEYATVTGKRLDTHPFAAQLDACDSPKAVSDLLRTQAQSFSKFRKGDDKLMAVLDPTVHILFTVSATLGEGIGLVNSLVSSGMAALQHDVCSRSHLPKRYLLASAFSSG